MRAAKSKMCMEVFRATNDIQSERHAQVAVSMAVSENPAVCWVEMSSAISMFENLMGFLHT